VGFVGKVGARVSESNEEIVRMFFEGLWSEGDLRLVDELVAPEHVHHFADEKVHGREGVRALVQELRSAFPDLNFSVDDVVDAGQKVAVRWTAHGTHHGVLGDLQPTARRARWTGIDIIHIRDRRIVELWAGPDGQSLWEQLTSPSTSGGHE